MKQDGSLPECCRQRVIRPLQSPAMALSMVLLPLLLAVVAFAEVRVPPSPPARVVDLAGLIPDDQESRIEGLLAELERKTTSQIVVFTIPVLDGESIESFSLRVAELWRLGQKGKDNGMLLTVAARERQYRFEVGYGLETILPDSFVGTLGREALVPAFKSGDFGGGILKAMETVATRIALPVATDTKAAPAGRAWSSVVGGAFNVLFTGGVVLALLAVLFFSVRDSGRRRSEAKSLAAYQKRARHPSWRRGGTDRGASSTDSDSDSGSDSLSGGGGSFGGGGASGRW